MAILESAYALYSNRDQIMRIAKWIIVFFCVFALIIYLIFATAIAIIQGYGKVSDHTRIPNLSEFSEFQSFTYKMIYGETWYEFKHPYYFPTLGVLTQGVILDASAMVGYRHVAWDIADNAQRQTEVKSFADGTVLAVNTNTLHNTNLRWKFCDNGFGICWYAVLEKADIQFGCGYEVIIQHADSLSSQYCHLESEPLVKIGNQVTVGQTIGYQGSSGWATGKHLHFALWRDGQPIPPSYAFTQTSLSNYGK
ncbi:MAG TPA: M23 family metallopeptidase [Patescibacteria group bacterium]